MRTVLLSLAAALFAAAPAKTDQIDDIVIEQMNVSHLPGVAVAVVDNGRVTKLWSYGDANLDAIVNIADFAALGANFNVPGTVWASGDFNYDGNSNIADFSQLAANFNRSLPSTSARGGGVPEPAATSFGLLAAATITRRRGRAA